MNDKIVNTALFLSCIIVALVVGIYTGEKVVLNAIREIDNASYEQLIRDVDSCIQIDENCSAGHWLFTKRNGGATTIEFNNPDRWKINKLTMID